ncbi:MAG: thiamine pyrophosphate-binding protein [Bacteroidetes bacterium]|nr:MAG: thiamine pyrophosphate-binding protein [Bacteroidota bacterium]
MKKSGAFLTVYALEQIGVRKTFGIPGVHNMEIYNQLNRSPHIEPILVTHEGAGAFMADAVSRTSNSIGTMVIVPAAGMTHALSGIGEAYLNGIPMLIISGGTRRDTGKSFQLNQLNMEKILDGIIKKYSLVKRHEDIIPGIFNAYNIAMEGEPGPVFIEIPVELQVAYEAVGTLPKFPGLSKQKFEDSSTENKMNTLSAFADDDLESKSPVHGAVDLLLNAKNPGLYVGWGAVDAFEETKKIAELLGAPVSTTLQGKSSFPANHPLHTSIGYGPTATPAGQNAFKNCDCLLAVGVRFSELATGSYSLKTPTNLIHVDINSDVFNKNYSAQITLEGDAKQVLEVIIKELESRGRNNPVNYSLLANSIKKDKEDYRNSWLKKANEQMVSPGFFFNALRNSLNDEAFVVTDDGNHTFLTAELFPVHKPRNFISPTDFNCMGYGVPATIATKLMNKTNQVVGIVSDGAFMMTGLELVTAFTHKLGLIIFVFHDGELVKLAQLEENQQVSRTSSIIGEININGIADAVHAKYIQILNDVDINGAIKDALEFVQKRENVIVDVNIDYSRKTNLEEGVLKANLSRMPISEKIKMLLKTGKRHILGE